MFKQSLALRVLAVCFLVLALPLLIYTFIFFNRSYKELFIRANKTLEEASLYRTLALEETTPVALTFLQELNFLLDLQKEIRTLPNPALNKKFMELTGSIPDVDAFVIVEGKNGGYQIASSDSGNEIGDEFKDVEDLKYVAQKGSGNFVHYHYVPELKATIPYLYSSLAIYDPSDHKLLGFLALRENILEEQSNLLQPFQDGSLAIHFAVVDINGFIEAATDPKLEGAMLHDISKERQQYLLVKSNRMGLDFFAKNPLTIVRNSDNPRHFEFKWNGEMQMATLAPFSPSEIAVLAYTSKKQLFQTALSRFLFIYIILGLTTLLGAAFTYYLTHWMAKPLSQLMELMKSVREGNLNVRFKPEKFGFEINDLGNYFNETIATLLVNIHSAERENLKKEVVRKELEVAKKVQMELLPKEIPEVIGVKLAASYIPTSEVGGDFYDFFLEKDNLFLICADASGLGLSPCLYSLSVRSFFRAYAQMESDTGEIVCLVNNDFCDDTGDSGMFVTAIMAQYHLKSHVLTYYSAGHVPAMLRKSNGEVILLEKRGMALGVVKANRYVATSILVDEGDILLLYTDGIINATNEQGKSFSEERLKNLLQHRKWTHAQQFVDGIIEEVNNFTGKDSQEEEFVLVALKVL